LSCVIAVSLHKVHLFESSWKKLYTDRGIRKILERYATTAGLDKTISPHKLSHFPFTWLKKEGLDDAMIQPYSGHASRQSLEIYSRLSLAVAQDQYDQAIKKMGVLKQRYKKFHRLSDGLTDSCQPFRPFLFSQLCR
jgi:integrase/recombinase XerD